MDILIGLGALLFMVGFGVGYYYGAVITERDHYRKEIKKIHELLK